MAIDDFDDSIKSPVVRDLHKDFKISSQSEEPQRTHGVEVLDFVRPGANQWDEDQLGLRKGRPSYSFNQLSKYGRQVINDMRMNMPQIRYIPGNDKEATKEGAEVREDLARAIQSSTEAEVAYDIAADYQVEIGWGYWSLVTVYENDKSFDQVIKYRQIPNVFKVYDDPYCVEQDKSDRTFLIEVEDISLSKFNRLYGKGYEDGEYKGYDYESSGELQTIGDAMPEWANPTKNIVRVADYWKVKLTKKQLWKNKKTAKTTNDKPSDPNNYDVRDIEERKVMWYKCTGLDKLSEQEFIVDEIPYFYVEGVCKYVDGKKYLTGLYEDAIPVQKLYNYGMNSAIELMAMAPKQPIIADWRATKGFDEIYDKANQENYSTLPYNGIDDDGQPVQRPERMQNSADLSTAATIVQMAESNLSSTIGLFDANLGKSSNEKSGKAILARQREGDTSTYHFPDNMARAQRYCGRVLLKMMEKVYDGARMVQLLGEDRKPRVMPINQEFEDKGEKKNFDLTKGIYDVMVTTGASYATKRQEAAEAQMQLAQAYPPLMQAAGDEIIRNMDWPGADKIADRLQKLLPPQLQEQPDMKDIPPQIAGQMQQMGMMIEQLQQQLQAAAAEVQNKQAEDQAKLGDLQIKAQQAQTQAQKDAADAEYNRMELQFKQEEAVAKITLEKGKQDLEWAKFNLDQMRVAKEGEQDMPVTKDELIARLQEMMHQEELTAEGQAQQASIMEAKALKDAEDRARSDALLQGLVGVQEMIGQLTASITAPKQVVRDETGMVSGVVTVGA